MPPSHNCRITDSATQQSSSVMADYKVIIVGAGMAGCAAGKALMEGGMNDFLILEATDRIGGRVNTMKIGTDGKSNSS